MTGRRPAISRSVPVFSGRRLSLLVLASIGSLAALLLARALGPSDLWDQTQPKTVSYTSDIIANGRWILPIELGEFPATKPVLYNWLAVPAVWLLGFASEAAHKFPSVLAVCLCWLALVRLGRRLDPAPDQSIGWLAGMLFVANYTIFKLGYLARPDMLLTLWLVLGWMAGGAILAEASGKADGLRSSSGLRCFFLALAFWLCVGLAGLTKGPAAITLLVFAVLGGKLIAGRWRAVHSFQWWWGFPLSLAMLGVWIYGVWRTEPDHLINELWYNEIYGRVTGTGPEGAHHGPLDLLLGAPYMALYYLVRFLPWSIPSVIAIVALWRRSRARSRSRRWHDLGGLGLHLHSAAVFVIVIVGLYTLSAGKRADYIAAAFAPGALLAAWWLRDAGSRLGHRWPGFIPMLAAAVLAVLIVVNEREPAAPVRGFGDEIMAFARRANAQRAGEELPVEFCWTGDTHLQAMMGFSRVSGDGPRAVFDHIRAGRPCWVVAGTKTSPPPDFDVWLRRKRPGVHIRRVVSSATLPRAHGWPVQVHLYRIDSPGER